MSGIVTVRSGPVATLIVQAGDGPTLIQNPGPNTVYLGDDDSILPSDATGIVPFGTNGSLTVDGSSSLYGITLSGQTQALTLISGGLNFFSPPSVPTLAQLGGISLFVQPNAPVGTIALNSLWFNTTAPVSLNYWNGAAWVTQAFAGNQIIQASTIVASLIAAGIILAGVVDGTTIQANEYIGTSAMGEALYYSTPAPALNALVNAIAGAAGVDGVGNNYPAGLFSQQLTLANQGVAPPSFANASVLYSSTAGRPRYKSAAGADNVIPRSDVNVATFTVANAAAHQPISAQLNYIANEGNQGSEYEIEIDAVLTTATTATALNFQMSSGGNLIGPHVTIGATMLPIGNTFFIILRARLTIIDVANSLANISFDGGIAKSANVGSESAFPVINASMQLVGGGGTTFLASASQTLLIETWGSNMTVKTWRTRITRRF